MFAFLVWFSDNRKVVGWVIVILTKNKVVTIVIRVLISI